MVDAPERESYFGESDAGQRSARGGEPRARPVAVAEARQAPADLGAPVEQVRQDGVVELAAHFRRFSGELSRTRRWLERAEAKLARSELARASGRGSGPGGRADRR